MNIEQVANVLDKCYKLVGSRRIFEHLKLEENDRVLVKKGTDKFTKDDLHIHIYKEYFPNVNIDKKFNDLSTDNVYIFIHNILMEKCDPAPIHICVKEYSLFNYIEDYFDTYNENEIYVSDNTINLIIKNNNIDVDSFNDISKIDNIILNMLDDVVKQFKAYMKKQRTFTFIMYVPILTISIEFEHNYMTFIDNRYLSYINNLLTSIEIEKLIKNKRDNSILNITNDGIEKIIEKRNTLYKETGVYFNIFKEGNRINYIADDGLTYFVDLSEKDLGFYLRHK